MQHLPFLYILMFRLRIAKILFIEQKYYLKIAGLQECYESVPPSLAHVCI